MPQIVVWKVGLHDRDNSTLAGYLQHPGLFNWLVRNNKNNESSL